MEIAGLGKGLDFLELQIKCVKGKLSVDVFTKPTNSHLHVLHVRTSTEYQVELHLHYAKYVKLIRSWNLLPKSLSNI